MDAIAVLADAYGRLPHLVRGAVDGLDPAQLTRAPQPGANTVGWLVWHLTRVQDGHVAELIEDAEQLYVADGWAERFGLPADPHDVGFGHTPEQVAAVRPESGALLVDHYDAVHERTMRYLEGLSDADLDRVVDENWDPPVTLGVRLVSVVEDDLQHVGQAAYLRGLLVGG